MPGRSNRGTNVEIVIFGFLVSLTLKGTLDSAYGKALPLATSWEAVTDALGSLVTLQVLILLLTLIRFVYGAYRFQEATQSTRLEKWVLPWIVPGLLVLFVLFYMAGLCVLHPVPFYGSLVVIHTWDLLAFLLPLTFSDKLDGPIKTVVRAFVVLDVVTMLGLLLIINCISASKVVPWCAASLMILCAVADLWFNRSFYFPAPEGEEETTSPSSL